MSTVLATKFPLENLEVVVVVDGSTDGTLEYLRGLNPPCSLRVFYQDNHGQGHARNVGARSAKGELILFLDDDILCEPNLITNHVGAHRHTEEPIVVSGPVLHALESPRGLAADWMADGCRRNVEYLKSNGGRWAKYQPWIGPNCSMRRSLFLSHRGYDETFRGALEDADLGIRLWNARVRFVFEPTAVTHHIYTKSARELVQIDAQWFGKNEVKLCSKHPEYRSLSQLAHVGAGPLWKRLLRTIALQNPVSKELAFGPLCWAAERLRWNPMFQRFGLSVLNIRMSATMLRSAAGAAGSWKELRSEFGMNLPILLYDHVGPTGGNTRSSLTPQRFERHLKWLSRNGYVGITPSEWLAWRARGGRLPHKPILLAFSQSYADLSEYALPALQRYSFGAVLFVVTKHMGRTASWPGSSQAGLALMNSEQILRWSQRGIEFGAHSRTYCDLTGLDEANLAEEIVGSKRDLIEIVGDRVICFSYPFGFHNEKVCGAVSQAFDLAFTRDEGLNFLSTDPFRLRASGVNPLQLLSELRCQVSLGWNPIARACARLGVRGYTTSEY
jgi:GT2 family glycosyltransferase/peptidoglycan/xylan/chitin deacetylase (PgdA/CDA1 family)